MHAKWSALALVVFAMGALAAPVLADQSTRTTVDVRIGPAAEISPEGVITGRVRVACPAERSVLEALVTVSQDDQAIWNQGSIRNVRCSGKHHWLEYRAQAYEEPGFHAGTAYVSAYVVVVDERDETTESGGDTRTVRVR